MQDTASPVAAAIRALRREPKLAGICRMMRGGILAHPWVKDDPAVQRALESVKVRHHEEFCWRALAAAQRHMEAEQAALAARYQEITSSARYRALPELPRRMFEVLHAVSGDPDLGGPNVMASSRVMVLTIREMFGRQYSLKAITWAGRVLEDAGLVAVTRGTGWQGFAAARSTVYHLLPGWEPSTTQALDSREIGACVVDITTSRIRRAFRAAIEFMRDLKRRLRMLGGHLGSHLALPDRPPEWDYSEILPV